MKAYHSRHKDGRAKRRAFELMKVNSLSSDVRAYIQDKFQYYLKYSRKLSHILNKSILSNNELMYNKRHAFQLWKQQALILKAVLEKGQAQQEHIRQANEAKLIEESQAYLIQSVYLHKDSI